MRMRACARASVVAIVVMIAACGGQGGSSDRKVIKSTTVGTLTIALTSPAGELKSGNNELMITFEDSSGKPLDVGAASLNFHMPAMGSMAEMNNKATLTTTNIPGWYHAKITLESAGTWEAQIKYQGTQGAGQASMTVNVK